MLSTINIEQEKLLGVLNEIFVYVVDSGKKQIIINPELTNESLDEIVVKTREIIIGLYLQCESDYIDGLKLYQALIESQMFVNEKSKENNLNRERESLFNPNLSRGKPDTKNTNIPSPLQSSSKPSNIMMPSKPPQSLEEPQTIAPLQSPETPRPIQEPQPPQPPQTTTPQSTPLPEPNENMNQNKL